MSEREARAGALSASKKALLERMLAGREAKEPGAPTIPRRPPGVAPLSFAQQRLWFIHQIDPESPAYNVPNALRLRGRLDEGVLGRALDEVVRRHESLRTRFVSEGGAPRQVVDPARPVPLPVVDLTARAERERESELARLAREEAAAPFDLGRGPLLRARLLRVGPDDHAFLLTMHHIVSDGWSMGVLVREIATLYEAFAADRPSPLPEIGVQYADFAVWQREALAGARGEREMAYWRGILTPLPPALDLPSDRPRPALPSFRGSVERVAVPAATAASLRALAREADASLFMVLLAAFTGLLSRLTGEKDVAIGTGIANRTLPELEPLIGFFVNALVLRTRCDGDPSFRALVARAKETVLGAFAHQELPFERIVEELQPERDLARNPMFQVAFALQNAPLDVFELPGLSIGPAASETGATRFDLEFHIWERDGGGLDGFLFYAADLFDAATVRRIAARYGAILASVAETPDLPLSRHRIAAGDELAQASRLTRGEVLPASPSSPLAQFEAQATRAPDAPAVAEEGIALSYGELDAAARRLAATLRGQGARRGSRVAILSDRSAAQVVATLAVAKTGAAYVPLDLANPDARLRAMLARSGASLALAPSALGSRLDGGCARLVPLDLSALIAPIAPIDPGDAPRDGSAGVTGDDLAYVIFTSGSTGEPNGVEVTHEGLANLVTWHRAAFGVTASDRATLIAGPGFDASVWEMWPALASGASLWIPDASVRLDPAALRDWLVERRASIAFLPTPLAERVLSLDWPEACALRLLLTGGDRLHALEARPRPFRVVNNYGPTEAAVVATSGEADGGGSRRAPTIGRPISNAAAYLLDTGLGPVPVGVAGELFIGGAGVARGYAGRPDLTAERFLPDPFAIRPGARMYRTGDGARQLADGRIEFLGRVDAQIKVRGVRVEPGEIESALARHPRVAAAAVVGVRDGETRLVAYVVPRPDPGEDGEQESQHVARWRELYDATYRGSEGRDDDFNIAGWNSSYTGAPIDPGEMREWRDETVARILALGARRVLEIGCGTGLLLSRLAPRCERYVATDFSRASLDLVRRLRAGRDDLARVEVMEREADDFTGLAAASFDVVILNSVVQYFPDRAYLERVLEGALRLAAPGGNVFVGDVRDLRLQRAFAASVALEGAPMGGDAPGAGPAADDAVVRARAEGLVAREEELLVHPSLFAAVCGAERRGATAVALVKKGRADNELTRFRYDVVLHVGRVAAAAEADAAPDAAVDVSALRRDAEEARSLDLSRAGGLEPGEDACLDVRRLTWGRSPGLSHDPARATSGAARTERSGETLTKNRNAPAERAPAVLTAQLDAAFRAGADVVVLSDVPNARLAGSMAAAQRLAGGAPGPASGIGGDEAASPVLHPDETAALGDAHGYRGTTLLSPGRPEVFDVVFVRSAGVPAPAIPFAAIAAALPKRFAEGDPLRADAASLTNAPLRATLRGELSAALRAHAASLLPEAMVPSLFVFLDALPTTPSGKIDRGRLPAPEETRAAPSSFVEPRTPTERAIARIWVEVLGLERVGATDDFFAIGGHSLLATQVLSRLRSTLGVEITLRAVFESPILAALAAAIDTLGPREASGQYAPSGTAGDVGAGRGERIARGGPIAGEDRIARVDRGGPLPLSFAQQRLWFIDALEPGGAAYNISNAIRFQGRLDTDALSGALAEIVRRHEPLRTRFVAAADGPRQIIDPPGVSPLVVEDLTAESDPEGRARALVAIENVRPFDLARGPLLRARLFRLAPNDHVLSLVVHHIAADGWSVGVLVREMGILYAAFTRGEESPLAELAVQYADWAQWQRDDLGRGGFRRQLDWWREELAGVAPLELPTDRPRPPHPSQWGEAIDLTLERELVGRIARVAQDSGATLHMALLAAFGAVLGRWSGQGSIAIGTPVAGRVRVEIEPLVGFFVNTLAIRVRLEGRGLTYRELLGRVRAAALSSYAHQDVPFEQIVEEIQPERDTSRNPVFQAMLALHNVPIGELVLPGLAVSGFDVEHATVQFDLEMSLFEAVGGSLSGRLHFARDLFERPRMERLAAHFRRFLEAVAADPDVPIRRAPMLPEQERRRLAGLQEHVMSLDAAPSLEAVFEHRAAQSPRAEALAGAAADGVVTYAELEARANRLAHLLAARGASRGARVALCLPRGTDLVVAVLAVLKTGAAYVPVDLGYPEARIALMLEDAAPALVVTLRALRGRLPESGLPVVALDNEAAALAACSAERPERAPSSPDDVAYVVYTSGTTGRPKGIAMRQAVVTNMVAWQRLSSGSPPPGRRTAQFASLSFDVSVQEIFATFAEGGTLVLLTEEERRDPGALLDALERERIERLFVPFVALASLAEAALTGPPRALRVREVVTAGEQLRVTDEIRRFFASLPGATLDNHYGPSEAHVVTAERLAGDPSAWPALPAVGRPVPNARVLVLDAEMQPSPLGVPGEIHVGGDVLARGYLGRADLTADRFVPDPEGGGARLYRTGDLGAVGEDGRITFLGRIDRQLKVRGYRIEPAEIEAAIAGLPGVRAVVVDARAPGGSAPRLVAWIVPEGEGASAASVRAELLRSLPDYLVPTAYVMLASLPLDPNGKVDRKALPDPIPETAAAGGAEPSPIESLVAGIFEDVLGVRRVGRDASFFELGGHSLIATRAVARIRRAAGVELPLRTVFERPTVRALAEEIAALLRGDAGARDGGAPRTERGTGIPRRARGAGVHGTTHDAGVLGTAHDAGVLGTAHEAGAVETAHDAPWPVSYQQERLWFLDQFETPSTTADRPIGGSGFTMLGALRLRGDLDAWALAKALDALARRHESLRTRFPSEDGRPVQVVDPPPAAWRLELEDLAAAAAPAAPEGTPGAAVEASARSEAGAEAAAEAALRARLEEEAECPFDLARGPLWRTRLMRLSDADHVLVIAMHHIITDGWSMGVLVRELGTLYEAYARDPEAPRAPRGEIDAGAAIAGIAGARLLPDLPIQYADYAAWQRQWLGEGELARQLAWWTGRLRGIEPLELPADHPRPPAQSHAGARVRARIGPELGARLRAVAREEGATLHMVLLAAYALVLGRWSGRDDLAVGTPVAGRTREETEGLIGFFVNTLVLRVHLSPEGGEGPEPPGSHEAPKGGTETFRSLLARVRDAALGAYAHQDVPFESLLEALRPARDLSRSPLFQVWFNLVNVPEEEPRFGPLSVTPMGAEAVEAKFDLSLYAVESGDAIDLDAVYASDLFDPWRIEEILAQLEAVLVQAAARPEMPLADVSLVTGRARRELADAEAPLSTEWRGPIHELFAARAAADPRALAVLDPAGPWTYAELAARARGLAHALAALGVRKGDAVAIYAHRSAPTVAAMLGVLEAGGAIVMLDPAHPAARLRLCLEEARPRAVVEIEDAGPLPRPLADFLRDELGAERLVLARAGSVADATGSERDSPLNVRVGPDDAACITFTSGSTGRPKGVVGRHGSLTHFQPYLASRFGIGPADRFSMLSGLAHDPLQRDVFTPLAAGGSVIVPAAEEIDPGRLAAWARSAHVTVMTLTPAMGKVLAAGAEPGSLPDLRTAFLVGEMLGRADAERLRAIAPGAALVNLYGTTETQRAVGHFVMPAGGPLRGEDDAPVTRGSIPAGRGMPDAQLLVRRAGGEAAGLCEQGEIWVRSPHLALGYLDPALTRARFAGEGPARAYRTGDLGRYERGGVVVVEGRGDMQVNVRGFRIELGEVEAALAAASGVGAAVAALDAEGRLVGYVTPAGEAPPEARAVREDVRVRLPEPMVPAAIVVLEAFPLTPNGKIDRKALPAAAFGEAAAYAPPRSPDEEVACALFADVLGIPRAGIADSFFDLGGHSLLATRLVARARASFGVEVSLRALFESPTPEGFARTLAAARRPGETAPPGIGRASDADRAGLSYAQSRIWFLDRLQPGTAAFNVASALRLDGDLDAGVLARVFAALEARHESLRTRIASEGERAWRIVDPPRPDPLSIVDLSGLADAEAEVERRLAEDASTPVDMDRGPLWRATLWRLSPRAHVLSLVIHHIATDGWSMDVLTREMTALYGAFGEGRESPLEPLRIQHADWAAWQRAWLEGGERERQLAWWRRDLAGARPVDLPTDRPRPARRGLRGGNVGFEIPEAAAGALARFAREEGATLFHVLLACFQGLLSRHAAARDVIVGIPVANRTREEAAPLVGLFVNTLAIRTRLDAEDTLRTIVRRVREKTLDAHARQDVPFEVVVEAVGVERDLARNPLFDAMFVLQHAHGAGPTAPGLIVTPLLADTGVAEFDLTLQMADASGRLFGSLVYDADLFDAASAERFAGHFVALAEALGRDPDVRLGDLELSRPEERARIALTNHTSVARAERTITDLFEAIVRKDGAALAVRDEDEALTYAQLDARAGAVARRLRAAGVGPETGVGLLARRNARSIVGMMGILKSGGVFVPLDPSLPSERLAKMIADAGVRAIVADRGLEGSIARAVSAPLPVVGLDEHAAHDEIAHRFGDPADAAMRPCPAVPSNAAYVIFTSGSTGEPKGSVVEHRAIADRLLCRAAQAGLGPGQRVLHFFSLAFDPSLEEILAPLVCGAAVVVHPDPRGDTPADWTTRVARDGVTVAHLPVGFVNELADDLARTGARLPACLRVVVTGAETPSGPRLADLLRAGRTGLIVTNAYGPTEAVIEATVHDVHDPAVCADPVPIGAPLENTRVHLLDARLRPVPFGAFGELFIGGLSLARGYAARPAETAAAFVPDPFAEEPGARLYRTGDLARYRADGALVFAGRRDTQIKIRGFRVELEDVEAALLRAPGVREAAVLVSGKGAHARLAGFVVPSEGSRVDPAELREILRAALPDYMIPATIVPLAAMPRTIGDKIDRRALLAQAGTERQGGPTAPRDAVERSLAGIWRATLGVEVEDVHENFFEAGGNSLLAVRLAAAVRREMGLDLAIAELFRRPTIAALARALRGADADADGDVDAPEGASADLVTLRAGAGLPPLVCVHEIGGGVASFASLAPHLDPRRPLLGVQGLDTLDDESVEDAAARHAAAIAAAVPDGPIHLLGWSYGAWLAFEIAHCLEAAGREIGMLVLLDAAAPDPRPAGPAARRREPSAGAARAAEALWGLAIPEGDGGPARVIDAARAAGALPDALPDAEARTWLLGVAARLEAADRYRPRPREGDVVLVRGTESTLARAGDETLGWGRFVKGRVTVVWAPGSHQSIVHGEGARAVASMVEHHAATGAGLGSAASAAAPPPGPSASPSHERSEGMEGTR